MKISDFASILRGRKEEEEKKGKRILYVVMRHVARLTA